MSGIVGVMHLDRSPVGEHLLQQLTASLSFRGPDGNAIWTDGHLGFGYSEFKTTEDSGRAGQPFTLDGAIWIVGDARIDGRRDLVARLQTAINDDLSSAPDVELILRAYHVWGEDCVKHLLGDFAFGIWDKNRQRLFCARDQMGVKPFYYAQVGRYLIFSNTLDCVRQHPSASDKLNDVAVGDFLLFGFNQDPATTIFADIQRIPPAHCASWSPNGFAIRRYWSMPIDGPTFYSRSEDYLERFRELLQEAVSDRLRTNSIGIFMSGGIDSPTLAATARSLLAQRYSNFELRAVTNVDQFGSEERHFAEMVARHLDIRIYFREWTRELSNLCWDQVLFRMPEPCPNPSQVLADREFWRRFRPPARVFFFGEGPDNALRLEWRPYVSYLARLGRYDRLLSAFYSTLLSERRPPFWGRLSNRISRRNGAETPFFPPWLNTTFESRLQLRDRWKAFTSLSSSAHPLRPAGYASLHNPLWQAFFQYFDAGATRFSFEVRHPFVDLRVLRYMLSVPALPWCRSKFLLRRAMRAALPKAVLRRKKANMRPDSLISLISQSCAPALVPAPDIHAYVNLEQLSDSEAANPRARLSKLLVRSLNHWLQHSHIHPHNAALEGGFNEFIRK